MKRIVCLLIYLTFLGGCKRDNGFGDGRVEIVSQEVVAQPSGPPILRISWKNTGNTDVAYLLVNVVLWDERGKELDPIDRINVDYGQFVEKPGQTHDAANDDFLVLNGDETAVRAGVTVAYAGSEEPTRD